MWIFYIPISIHILILAFRYGGIRQLSAINPCMPNGGLVDSNKAGNLLAIQADLPETVAKTGLLYAELPASLAKLDEVMTELELSFPIILKPNSGQRGMGVSVIDDSTAAERYLTTYKDTDILVQEYVDGEEFGVFYMREPSSPNGFVFSITHKLFPKMTGDGTSTLERLILEDPRAHYMARFLLKQHAEQLERIPEKGEQIEMVEIGSHCRGSVFIDANAYLTPVLEARIDEISKAISGYYYGRYDLRVSSIDALKQGKDIKIIEANGLTSESTDIYDPKNSLIDAYKVVFRQWHLAFKIAKQNRINGERVSSYREILSSVRSLNRGPS